MEAAMLRVATFNIRHDADRYALRKPLLGAAFAGLAVDIAGLQEVRFADEQQHLFLGSRVPDRPFDAFDVRSIRDPEFGNAILCRAGSVEVHEELRLPLGRVAQRVLVLLPGNRTMWFANVHVHHVAAEPEVRTEQASAYATWLLDAPQADAIIAVGDFNAPPTEDAYHAMASAGFVSAHQEVHGREPAHSRPPGAIDQAASGEPTCVDYIWVRGRALVRDAGLGATEASPDDATLYPSDHLAVVATIAIG